MKGLLLLFGIISYGLFFITFIALMVFLSNLSLNYSDLYALLPVAIDSYPATVSLSAISINLAFIGLFGLQHSIMARQGFKAKLCQYIPKSAERSLYVLLSSTVLLLMMFAWQPMTTRIWHSDNHVLQIIIWCIYASGWLMVLMSSFIINHFDLFGLRQSYLAFRNKPYHELPFQIRSLYKWVRHPLYLGFLLAFWATPSMSLGHLLFSIGMSIYIVIGMHYEEQDLVNSFGDQYSDYQHNTPQIIPFCKHAAKNNKE